MAENYPTIHFVTNTQKIRQEYEIPVMILSAKVQLDDRVLGLELGADDYITKPFEPLEVTARVKAHLRRESKKQLSGIDAEQNIIKHKDMILDIGKCQLIANENIIDLTKTELALMERFMKNPGRVFTREQIFECGWGDTIVVDDNTIRVTISRLRDKIGNERIKTIRGLGYRLEV